MRLSQNVTQKYTYKDLLDCPENEKWELIEGIPSMQAAPTWQHQEVSLELVRQFANFLQGKTCRVFTAPFDLCLPEDTKSDEELRNVLQPDLVVVCEPSKLRKSGYFGVPSLVIEITSPATARRDKLYKFNLYEQAGVKEYWIVEPEQKLVSVFVLQENQRYGRPEVSTEEEQVATFVFPELKIDLGLVFANL